MPIANNMAAMERALRAAGASFVSNEDGSRGVVAGGLRWGPYVAGTGLHLYVPLVDLDMEPSDETELWFLLEDSSFYELIGRLPRDDSEAKQIGREHRARILNVIRDRVGQYWTEGDARPRRINAEDFEAKLNRS